MSKFTYLVSCLKGTAKKTIEGYAVTSENYAEAIKDLKERFGNLAKLVSVYYAEVNDLVPAKEAEGQLGNLDAIKKILKNLATLGWVLR